MFPSNDNSSPDSHQRVLNLLAPMAASVEPVRNAKLATCIVYKGRIIAYGWNQLKSHPFQKRFQKNTDSIFLHGETDVIKKALRFLDEWEIARSTLYVCRVKQDIDLKGKHLMFGLAKPCAGCSQAIATYDIKKVVYSVEREGYEWL